jgi:hypothetical protein
MTTLLATLQTIALLCSTAGKYPDSTLNVMNRCQKYYVECHLDKGKELTTCIKEKK